MSVSQERFDTANEELRLLRQIVFYSYPTQIEPHIWEKFYNAAIDEYEAFIGRPISKHWRTEPVYSEVDKQHTVYVKRFHPEN